MPVPSTTTEFLDLLTKSGLYPAGIPELPESSQEPAKLAAAMVRRGMLTPFQARLLLSGRYRGFRLGQYVIRDQIGHGGMGAVYLAEHQTLRKLAAIKVLAPGEGINRLSVERFLREARLAAALDHPNIVRTYDIGDHRDTHFLVMEYVEGQTLDHLLQVGGPIACGRAVEYIAQAAAGLQHAYEKGFIHRDIKPANLILAKDGTIKLLDMGLARSFETDDRLTEKLDKGAVVGTADYISPEQAMNSPNLDIRSDIYSLGATFFTLVTGRPPFEGSTTQKLVQHQMKSPPSLSSIDKTFPPGLSTVIAKMLAKKPEDRYQTPAEVITALAPWVPKSRHVVAGLSRTNLDQPSMQNTLEDVATGGTKRIGTVPTKRPRWLFFAGAVALAIALGSTVYLIASSLVEKGDSPTQVTLPSGPTEPTPPTFASSTQPTTRTTSTAKSTDQKSTDPTPAAPRPALNYALMLNASKTYIERGSQSGASPNSSRWTVTTRSGTGSLPIGWQPRCTNPATEAEFELGTVEGKPALSMRNVKGPASMVLVSPEIETPGSTAKLQCEYRADSVQGGLRVVFRPTRPASKPELVLDPFPVTPGQWVTQTRTLDVPGVTAGVFEFQTLDETTGTVSLAGMTVWDSLPAPEKGLLRLDLTRQQPFVHRAAKDMDPNAKVPIAVVSESGTGKIPAGWYRWVEYPDGVVEYFADGPSGEIALGIRNVAGTPGMMLTSPEFPAPQAGSCRLRVLYQTGPDSPGFVIRMRPILPERKPSWDIHKFPPTAGSWKLAVIDFDLKGSTRGLLELYNVAPGEGGAVRFREVTVLPAKP